MNGPGQPGKNAGDGGGLVGRRSAKSPASPADVALDRAVDAYWANRKLRARDEPWASRLAAVADSKVRRCHWCGSWCYDADPCNGCTATVAEVAA